MNLEQQLFRYKPYNEQEERDKTVMLSLLATEEDVFTRENQVAHFTASAWLLNKTHDKVLMIYHNIYNSWAWTGGHADGDTDLLAVALREAQEETGVTDIRPVGEDIFSIEILTVDGHEKRGAYVPSHLHLNVTYLLEADEEEVLCVKPDENSGVKWFPLDEALEASTEPWMITRVYTKLNEKLHNGKFAQGFEQEGTRIHAERNNTGIRDCALYGHVKGVTDNITPERISDETIDYVGILSKLELSDEEKERAKKDMGEMIDYIDKLNELDTEGVEPMTHVFPLNNVFREDIVTNADGSEATMANAPEQKDGGFKVPMAFLPR